jgi:hypothetical protein
MRLMLGCRQSPRGISHDSGADSGGYARRGTVFKIFDEIRATEIQRGDLPAFVGRAGAIRQESGGPTRVNC